MPIPEYIRIVDRKKGDGGVTAEFEVDGVMLDGVVSYNIAQPLDGLPRVTFTVLARRVDAAIQARIEEGDG